jgi:SAM-dependent methyltransferase
VPDLDRKSHYSQPEVVAFYTAAAAEIGLWRSEEVLFRRLFAPRDVLLNVGCGAGRVSLALWELGYHQVLGLDFAHPMVEAARLLATKLEYAAPFRVGDVTRLGFDPGAFDGVLWPAAGWGDLPDDAARGAALASLRRVIKAGGTAVVTILPTDDGSSDGLHALFASNGWQVKEAIARNQLASEPDDVIRRYPEVTFWVLIAV